MDEKDVQLIVEKVGAEAGKTITSLFEQAKTGLMTAGEFADQVKGFASKEDITGLTEKLEQIAVDMKKRNEFVDVKKTVYEIISSQKAEIEALNAGRKDVNVKFSIPSRKTDFTTASVGSNTQAIRVPGFNELAYRLPMVADLFFQSGIGDDSGGSIRYQDVTTTTRSAAARTENNPAAESELAMTEYNLGIMNISDSIPVTREAMKNFTQLESLVRKFIMTNLDLAEEAEVYSGDGSAPNLTGVYTTATAFLPASMIAASSLILDASHYDLISYLASYIASGKNSKYRPNFAIMNDLDVWTMLSKKDVNGVYVNAPFVKISGDQIYVGAVQVIPSSLVTANTMVVGDFNQGTLFADPAWEMTLGYGTDDFIKNRITLLGNKRAALLIKTLDATAFYKVTDVTAAILALTA